MVFLLNEDVGGEEEGDEDGHEQEDVRPPLLRRRGHEVLADITALGLCATF